MDPLIVRQWLYSLLSYLSEKWTMKLLGKFGEDAITLRCMKKQWVRVSCSQSGIRWSGQQKSFCSGWARLLSTVSSKRVCVFNNQQNRRLPSCNAKMGSLPIFWVRPSYTNINFLHHKDLSPCTIMLLPACVGSHMA